MDININFSNMERNFSNTPWQGTNAMHIERFYLSFSDAKQHDTENKVYFYDVLKKFLFMVLYFTPMLISRHYFLSSVEALAFDVW